MSDPLLTEKEVNAEIAKRSNLSDRVTQAAFFVGATWGAQKVRKKMEARAQPAQAGQVLTDAQANEIAKASFEKLCGRPHPWEGAQPWVIDAIKRAANGIVGEEGV